MDEIVKDFLIESTENLDRLDQELVKLEEDPQSNELLASIFRTIHTIKGSAGFLGFIRLQKVAHAGESLLSRLRDRQLLLTAEITSGLLAMVDAVRHMLSEIGATEQDGENDYPELLEMLARLQGVETSKPANVGNGEAEAEEKVSQSSTEQPSPTIPSPVSVPVIPTAAATVTINPELAPRQSSLPPPQIPSSTAAAESMPPGRSRRPMTGKLGGLLVERGQISPEELLQALAGQEKGDQRRLGEILVAQGLCKQEDIAAALQTLEARGRETAAETVRVGVTLLDKLMNLVGELVLARNQLLQFGSRSSDPGILAISQRMNLIASELQEEVMKTRMQPVGNTWSKFPRTVRDLALSCGKEVRLEMEGQGTELDRTIIEAVKDPLTHLVRNAVDHGIEPPEMRQHKGKAAMGCVSLRAFHEGGQVNIEISDDGAGLDQERIRAKAVERGIVTHEQAARLTQQEVFNLVFLPGFSTAEKITNVSGRGVGMDVVRTNLEKIGGTADLHSVAGKGTTVRIKIPLTLAIIPALVTRCEGERFAIPQISLTELVRLESAKNIEQAHGAPVYRLRGHLLPLVYLRDVLYPRPTGKTRVRDETESINIAVLQAGSRRFGLVVDEILDTEEIVVKPLGKQLKGISAYAGATIMGDGSVALILDVAGVGRQAGIFAESREPASSEETSASGESKNDSDGRQSLLLAEAGGRIAIPLRAVARLEEFASTVIEHAGGQEVMQYRGQIIPLIRLSGIGRLSLGGDEMQGAIQVVIYSEGRKTVGLIVDRIVDIVSVETASMPVDSWQARPGVSGTCVVEQRVTDLLDISTIVRNSIPGFLEAPEAVEALA
jgi:two-component system, chemotaxis family, sensor kinase CheA